MRYRNPLVVLIACGLVTVALGLFKFKQIQSAIAYAESFPEPSETVETREVQFKLWKEERAYKAEIVAAKEVDLVTEVDGRAILVGFSSGDIVQEGQILLRLDASEQISNRDALNARLQLATLQYDRVKRLFDNGVASKEEVDLAQTLLTSIRASLDASDAIIAKKTISAPFNARAGLHNVNVGEYVKAGTYISKLVGTGTTLYVDFAVPQTKDETLIGDEIRVNCGAASENYLSALIIAKDTSINRLSRSIRVRAALTGAPKKIVPGSVCKALVSLERETLVAHVPSSSILFDPLGPYVFVLKAASSGDDAGFRASKRRVVLGPSYRGERIIKEGVDRGEKIASVGAFKLREGILVYQSIGDPRYPKTFRSHNE